MLSERRVDSKRELDVLMFYSAVLLRMQCLHYIFSVVILAEKHDNVDNDQAPTSWCLDGFKSRGLRPCSGCGTGTGADWQSESAKGLVSPFCLFWRLPANL